MVSRRRACLILVASRLEYLLTNPWLIGAVALLAVSFGSIVVSNARDLGEAHERHALELQRRLSATIQPVGPSGRQVDRALRILRPPATAALLVAGQEPSMPAGWDVGPATVEALPPYAPLNASKGLDNADDGGVFIAQFGGLLALVFGLTNVLRDRRRGWSDAERGTTASPYIFHLADLTAACLAIAVAVGALFGAVGLVLHRVLVESWLEATQTLLMLAPLTWLYFVAFYAYGAAIGWYVREPLRAVAGAAIFWVCLVLVGPHLSLWFGSAVVPPSRARAEHDRRDAYTDQIRRIESQVEGQIDVRVGNSPSASERDRRATAAFAALEPAWIHGLEEARSVVNTMEKAWRTQVDQVAADLQRASRLPPSMLLPQILAELSGTGDLTRRRWEDSVSAYKKKLDQELFDDPPTVILRLLTDGEVESWMHVRHPVKPVRDLPTFLSPTITIRDRWQATASGAIALALHTVAALVLAMVTQRRAWRRYDFASIGSAD